MADEIRHDNSDPRHHTEKVKEMLAGVAEHARGDVAKVNDPKAQALFETTAEVLLGLKKAYDHYEQGTEAAWKKAS
jgi:hypothetical protein